ncbi:MAG: hypothetical protein KBD06_02465 [Candidatus Pacebacteria bacterium]|nr:hypothetical protein [Candidatus Paceibacterota bacterium]
MTIDLRKHAARTEQNHVRVPDAMPRAEMHRDIPRARTAPKRQRERAVTLLAFGAIAAVVLVLAVFGVTRAWGHFFGGTEYEIKSLVSDVGEHMLLPENETPTLATVTDLHALEGQLFFRNAKEGDKVLMYLISQQAILYRPSIDKIIEVGPITGSAQ